MRREDWST